MPYRNFGNARSFLDLEAQVDRDEEEEEDSSDLGR
jgi:hypothetical protein